jgi:sulfite exporter TauE/SafE
LLKPLAFILLAMVVFALFFQLKKTFAFSLDEISANANYGLLFLVGVLTSFHCIGMCGGFVLSYSVSAEKSKKSSHLSHFLYGTGKTLSYTGFGALFGFIGGVITITVMMKSIISGVAGLFLMMYGLSMMDAFAGLRRFHIRLPRFFVHQLFIQQRNTSNPLIIGLLNGLMIACGPLQAMYVLAAGTGDPIEGAKLLAVFAVGTLPLMLLLGYTANMVTANMTRQFLKISGVLILTLGVIMLNRGLLLSGAGYDFSSLSAKTSQRIKAYFTTWQHDFADVGSHLQAGYQIIYMEVDVNKYTPNDFTIRKDVPVKWILNIKQLSECNKQIVIPSLNKQFNLHPGLQIIEFTPTEDGVISWSCHMAMIPGLFIVSD